MDSNLKKVDSVIPSIDGSKVSIKPMSTLEMEEAELIEILKPKFKQFRTSPSTIYSICKRYKKSKLTVKMEEEKRQIIKEKAGELGHIDAYYLSKGIINGETQRYYLLAGVDRCTRLAWAELTSDIKALTTMFDKTRCFQVFPEQFGIKFS